MAIAGTTWKDELLIVTGIFIEDNFFLFLIWQEATLSDQLISQKKTLVRTKDF